MKSPYFIVITGPTGVGKTDLALHLAEHIPAEIVNGDMGQCYTPLTIGTAKPEWQHHPVPHHLFDIINEPVDFSVTKYRELVIATFDDIWKRDKTPIVVGGSGFYIKSLFFPPTARTDAPFVDDESQKSLWQRLSDIDPERAQHIHEHDEYRLKRALAIWQNLGKKPSEFKQTYAPPASYVYIDVSRDRDDLYQRIDVRVDEMIKHGWIAEVEQLQNTQWEELIKNKKIIGYELLLQYLNDSQFNDRALVIEHIKRRTRNYAKRQITFFKGLESQLQEAINNDNSNTSIFTSINLSHMQFKQAMELIMTKLK